MNSGNFIKSDIASDLRKKFIEAQPYGFAPVGDLFNKEFLKILEKEINDQISIIPEEKNIYASFRKHKLSNLEEIPQETRSFVNYLNSKPFLSILESITGIKNLHGDPDLQGGGIHAIGAGGFLKLHTDFNWHKKMNMHRRLNLLIYLNNDWQDEWLGAIELWDPTATEKLASFMPTLGTALLFETSDKSYHGHPDPLKCPTKIYRKSIAMYYYTPERPRDEIVFGKSEMTNYVERPGEVFGSDKMRRFRHYLQLRTKKLLFLFTKKN